MAEKHLGADLAGTELRADASSHRHAAAQGALAVTEGSCVTFSEGALSGSGEARALLGHELTHVAQQRAAGSPTGVAQKQERGADNDRFTGPLTDRELGLLDIWLASGEVGLEPLTDDPEHNADIVAGVIFCSRALSTLIMSSGEDPLLCIDPDVTAADPRVRTIRAHLVRQRGPIVHWAAVSTENRLVRAMTTLVDTYNYPVNGAAGIVGNLLAESGVLPTRVEGSAAATPLRAPNSAGRMTDFTAEEVMNRNRAAGTGPRLPGVGLAQWTTPARRAGLFQHSYGGRQLGSSILFNMEAQIDYLVGELRANAGLNATLASPGVSVNAASDDVVYLFEIPAAILDPTRNRLPRADPAVQAVFAARRANSQRALRAFRAVRP